MTPPVTTHGTTELRRDTALRLSDTARTAMIPPGPYCYRSIRIVTPPEAGHTTEPCPFLIGTRPHTTCCLNRNPAWQHSRYNYDAYKGCGINETEEGTSDAHSATE